MKSLYSSRYEAALHERDSLCSQSKQLMQDTTSLGKILRNEKQKLAKETKDHADLKKLYENLEKSSGAQLSQLSEDLTKKQSELEEKQKKVDQLEGLLREHQAMLDNLFSSIKKALVDFSPSELTVEMKNGKLYVSLLDKLLFESGKADGSLYTEIRAAFEKPLFELVLERTDGNRSKAAELLGINRNTLHSKMEEYGIKG